MEIEAGRAIAPNAQLPAADPAGIAPAWARGRNRNRANRSCATRAAKVVRCAQRWAGQCRRLPAEIQMLAESWRRTARAAARPKSPAPMLPPRSAGYVGDKTIAPADKSPA